MATKPDYIAYTVRDFEQDGEKKGRWLEIGAAWKTKDGEGFNLGFFCAMVRNATRSG